MSDFNVSLSGGQAKRLLTGGKYVPENIVVSPENLDTELTAQDSLLAQVQSALEGKVNKKMPVEKDVNFYDYDGTLLYSYTLAEAQALTELPPAPTPPKDFLEFQEWNWTLAKIKDYGLPVQVGAIYSTIDGKTYAVINIEEDWQKNVTIHYGQWCSSIVVDWGDGASEAPTTIGSGTNVTKQHTYSEKGVYTITVTANGTWNLGLNNASSPFFGDLHTNKNGSSALKEVYIGNGARLLGDAFGRAGQLSVVTIPTTATQTWASVFANCYSLTALIFPSTFKSLETYTARYSFKLSIVSLGSGVTSIGYHSFASTAVERITIPSSATKFGCGSSWIRKIIVPEGVETLHDGTLDSYHLVEVKLPASLKLIGAQCFVNTNSLVRIRFNAATPPTVSNANAFTGIPTSCIVEVPAASLEAYQNATNYASIAAQMVGV